MNADDPSSINPYQSPRPMDALSEEPGEPVAEIAVVEMPARKPEWRLSVYADRLRLSPPGDGPPQDVPSAELSEKVTVQDFLFIRRCVVVKLGKKKRIFQLEPEDFATFTQWLGPPTAADLKRALKKRLAWVLPIGCLIVLASVPMGGDRAAGIEPLPFDPVGFVLGGSLLLMGILSKWMPHPVFFLFDSFWFLALASNLSYQIFTGRSWLWIILVLFQLLLVLGGIGEYRRFSRSGGRNVSPFEAGNHELP